MKPKKKWLHHLPIWIAITAVSLGQNYQMHINQQTHRELVRQDAMTLKVIDRLTDHVHLNSQDLLEIAEILKKYSEFQRDKVVHCIILSFFY